MRDRVQASQNVEAFFEPKSVAVVGASSNPARGGHRIVENLLLHFDGPVYAVNPNADAVLGLECFPSVEDIPHEVDLAVVFIPAPGVPDVVRGCIAKGVRAVCVESGGFADAGTEGQRLQAELEHLALSSNTRVWGPNCAGYVSTNPPMSTSFVVTPGTRPGNVALVAQSGMMAAALLVQLISQDALAVSKACSIGNKVDVDESDLVAYLADDPQSEVIACYLESIVDGPRFGSALDAATQRAPVVALLGGRTAAGRAAALTHTGSVAGETAMAHGLLRQRGVLQVTDFMELVDVAGSLSVLPVREAGDRVAVVTFSGAAGVVATDLFDGTGLRLAELADQTVARLSEIYPPWLEPANPVDVWSTVERRGLEPTLTAALDAVLADPGVDSVLLVTLAFDYFDTSGLAQATEGVARHRKPVVSWVFGDDQQLEAWKQELRSTGIPVCRELRIAVRTLEALALRRRALQRLDSIAAAAPPDAESQEWPDGTILAEDDAKQILRSSGLPTVREIRASSPGEAAGAAEEIGFPVAVKLVAAGLAHKTELGAVRVGLENAQDVQNASLDILGAAEKHGIQGGAILVQSMVIGTELLVGVQRDETFGPVVVLGAGGVDVEATGEDVAVRPAPVTASDVHDMLRELPRVRASLLGHRGRPCGDLGALTEAVLAMSRFIISAPADVVEAEVNPLMVLADGNGVCAVDALIVRGRAKPELPAG